MGDIILSLIRAVFGTIDSIIYILISMLYDLLQDIASLILYSQDAIDAIGKRIGLILGIFMLFRVAISLMTYLVSPDKIKDEKAGGSKIVKNIIISLILLAVINPIFEQAYKIQIKVVQSRFIEKIFFGSQANVPDVDVAYSLYSSFLTPNVEACKDVFDVYVGISDECEKNISSITNHKVSDAMINGILEHHKLSLVLGSYDAINYKVNGDYFFDYFMIVSTISGVVVTLMLITFCMDLATRAIKLFFLQIIAPIPIIANIDPEKGSEMFKKWYKECISTYVSVFIRIIAINFAVFMMTLIQTEFHDVFTGKGPIFIVIIIIGCLMFAKQVPKLIENVTGIKSEGFTLNPIKKFEEQAVFGKTAEKIRKRLTAGAVGATVGAAGGAVGAFTGAGAGSIFSGALSGAFNGKGVSETWKNQASANARMRTALLNGSTFGGRVRQWTSDVLGTGGELADIEREKHAAQDEIDRIDRAIKAEEDDIAEIKGTDAYRERQLHIQQQNDIVTAANKYKERAISQVDSGNGTAGQRYQEMKRVSAGVKGSSQTTGSVTVNGNTYSWSDETQRGIIAEQIAQEAETYKNTRGWRDYADEVSNIDDENDDNYDAKLRNARNEFDEAYRQTHNNQVLAYDNPADPHYSYGNELNTALNNAINETSRLQVDGAGDERAIAAHNRTIAELNGQKDPYNTQLRDLSERERVANANKSAIGH